VSLEQEARRGQLAQEVIDNPVYTDAHEAVESEIVRLWKDSRDPKDREQLHALLGLHTKIKTAMESVMRSGEIASAELRRKQTVMERIKAPFFA